MRARPTRRRPRTRPRPRADDEAVGPDDGQTAEHAPASGGTSASPGDREQLGDVRPAATDDDEPVAVDPLPSTGSLVWADDTATALRPGRSAAEPPTATASGGRDDTTEVITPDQVVPPPYGADETAPPGWALPPRDPRPGRPRRPGLAGRRAVGTTDRSAADGRHDRLGGSGRQGRAGGATDGCDRLAGLGPAQRGRPSPARTWVPLSRPPAGGRPGHGTRPGAPRRRRAARAAGRAPRRSCSRRSASWSWSSAWRRWPSAAATTPPDRWPVRPPPARRRLPATAPTPPARSWARRASWGGGRGRSGCPAPTARRPTEAST